MICQRCLKTLPDKPAGASVHTCTPSKLVRELEQQRDELAYYLRRVMTLSEKVYQEILKEAGEL